MSAKVHNYYMKMQEKRITLLAILRTLAWDADHEGVSTMSIHELAESCSRSDRAIQTALRVLESEEKLGIKYQDGRKTKDGKTNRYFLNGYRISVDLQPVITVSPYESKTIPKTAPRAISNTKAVKFQSLGGEAICTHNNISKQNILNTTTQGDKNLVDNEVTSQRQFFDEGKPQSASVAPNTEKKESAMHVSQSTAQPSKNIVQPSTHCGEKAFLIKEETPTNLIFPLQMSKVEQAEISNLLIKQQIPHESWQDLIDTLAYQIKHKPIVSKAGYFVGILKKFKAGQFTSDEAKKIQSKRQPKQTSVSELKNKVEKLNKKNVEQNDKPAEDNQQTWEFIEQLNKVNNRIEINKIYQSHAKHMNNTMINALNKRLREVRA